MVDGKKNQIQGRTMSDVRLCSIMDYVNFFLPHVPLRAPPLTVEVLLGHKALWIFKPTPNDLLEGNDKMVGYAKSSQFCH